MAVFATTLWVGGLWAIGMAAYTLFANLNDKALAGMLAGKFFTLIAFVGMACGFYLLIFRLAKVGVTALKQMAFWLVLIMLVLTIAGHFGIQPVIAGIKAQATQKEIVESVFQSRFATWHGVASIVYVVESLLGLLLIFQPRAGSR